MKKLNRLIEDQIQAVRELEEAKTRIEKLEIKLIIEEIENLINEERKTLYK